MGKGGGGGVTRTRNSCKIRRFIEAAVPVPPVANCRILSLPKKHWIDHLNFIPPPMDSRYSTTNIGGGIGLERPPWTPAIGSFIGDTIYHHRCCCCSLLLPHPNTTEGWRVFLLKPWVKGKSRAREGDAKGVFWIDRVVSQDSFGTSNQVGYLGVFVEVNVGSPGSVKGEGIGQGVLGVYGVWTEKKWVSGVCWVPIVNSLKDRGVFGNQQHLVGGRLNRGLCTKKRLKTRK